MQDTKQYVYVNVCTTIMYIANFKTKSAYCVVEDFSNKAATVSHTGYCDEPYACFDFKKSFTFTLPITKLILID